MRSVTRRAVLAALATVPALPAAAALLAAPAPAAGAPGAHPTMWRPAGPPEYVFFEASEARFIEAACDRLIPADAAGPGALGAGVPRYLDRQLAGPWGAGESLNRTGPWQPGSPPPRQPPRLSPADIFRTALSAVRRSSADGPPFHERPAAARDAYLRLLAEGRVDLDGVPSGVFFHMLLGMTVEAFFSHPAYGGIRDTIAWPLHGFPGAYAASSGSPADRARC